MSPTQGYVLGMVETRSTVEVLGIVVPIATRAEALRAIESLGDAQDHALVAYVNAHTLNLSVGDPAYRRLLQGADLLLNDGSGIAMAARLKGKRFPDNLNGTDMNRQILELCARKGWSAYFLGSLPGVAEAAADRLAARIPGLKIVGHHHGYFSSDDDARVAEEIKVSGAEVVMVAMGNPHQERWLERNLTATGCTLGIGVGAFFDFSAERVRRAPQWMIRIGVEWVWRLGREPLRMWRRYVVGNPVFLWRVAREAWRERRGKAA